MLHEGDDLEAAEELLNGVEEAQETDAKLSITRLILIINWVVY
jgi:hypothetical protein